MKMNLSVIEQTQALSLGGKKTVNEMRTSIMALEKAMMASPDGMTPDDFNTKHHFSPGVYTRELFIPQGIVLTGKIHTSEHLNILSQGKITVWTEDGMKTLTASTVIRSMPLIKRVGYAHEDSIWITVHHNPSNETDIAKIEERLFCMTFGDAYIRTHRTIDDVVNALGITHAEMTSISENPDDQIDFPSPPDCIEVRESPIHGKGMFATRAIQRGVICPARMSGKRTPAGRFCNHSGDPNAIMVMRETGDVDLVALKDIEPGQEILNDYYLSFVNTRLPIHGGNQLCHA